MSEPTAIRATYADFRNVKTRQVCQIILEIPAEQSAEALRFLGGVPIAGTEKWFAIAPLDPKAGTPKEKAQAAKKSWQEMQLSQQAGILANDKNFWIFLEAANICAVRVGTADDAALQIRAFCEVQSRSEIIPGTPAAEKWRELVSEYRTWNLEAEVVPT